MAGMADCGTVGTRSSLLEESAALKGRIDALLEARPILGSDDDAKAVCTIFTNGRQSRSRSRDRRQRHVGVPTHPTQATAPMPPPPPPAPLHNPATTLPQLVAQPLVGAALDISALVAPSATVSTSTSVQLPQPCTHASQPMTCVSPVPPPPPPPPLPPPPPPLLSQTSVAPSLPLTCPMSQAPLAPCITATFCPTATCTMNGAISGGMPMTQVASLPMLSSVPAACSSAISGFQLKSVDEEEEDEEDEEEAMVAAVESMLTSPSSNANQQSSMVGMGGVSATTGMGVMNTMGGIGAIPMGMMGPMGAIGGMLPMGGLMPMGGVSPMDASVMGNVVGMTNGDHLAAMGTMSPMGAMGPMAAMGHMSCMGTLGAIVPVGGVPMGSMSSMGAVNGGVTMSNMSNIAGMGGMGPMGAMNPGAMQAMMKQQEEAFTKTMADALKAGASSLGSLIDREDGKEVCGSHVSRTNVLHPAYRPEDGEQVLGITDRRFEGKIRSFNDSQGYGFLKCAEFEKLWAGRNLPKNDVFLHRNQKRGFEQGDSVSFGVFLNFRGKPQATDLRKASSRGNAAAADDDDSD